jgi:hypothetical protein
MNKLDFDFDSLPDVSRVAVSAHVPERRGRLEGHRTGVGR